LQALSRHLATCLSARRLEPLWEALSTAEPDTVLPISLTWRAALLHPEDMDLLLTRRVVEILDARRVILSERTNLAAQTLDNVSGVGSATSDATTRARMREKSAPRMPARSDASEVKEERRNLVLAARKEADRLAVALGYAADAVYRQEDRTTTSAREGKANTAAVIERVGPHVNVNEPYYHAMTFADQVHYLESVASHLRRRRRRLMWKRRLRSLHLLASLRRQRRSTDAPGRQTLELR
jgi:hypothetical protein